jgi:membrane-associated phospholipid phosphatase
VDRDEDDSVVGVAGATHVLWTGLAVLVGLVLLTVAVGTDWSPVARLDQGVASRAYASTSSHALSRDVWLTVTTWGQPMVVRGSMIATGVVLALRRHLLLGSWLVGLAVTEGVVAPLAKLVLSRPRPSWDLPIIVEGSTSFPSGHAAAAATAATASVLVAAALIKTASIRRLLVVVAVALATAVAVSRVFLGVHFLSDVIGGVLLGGGLSCVTWWLAMTVVARLSSPKED